MKHRRNNEHTHKLWILAVKLQSLHQRYGLKSHDLNSDSSHEFDYYIIIIQHDKIDLQLDFDFNTNDL